MPPAYDPSAVRSGTILSDNPNYDAVWVCYVHGIEIPIVGFSTSSGVWQMPTFEIYTHPDVSLQRLGHEDRVPVQIFYMDYWYDPDRPQMRLLIDGEIKGYRSKKVVGQRVMSFVCQAHISVFEKLYFFFMNTVDDIVASQSPEVRTQGFTAQGLFYPYSLFHQGLFVSQGAGTDREVQTTTADEPEGQGPVVKTAHEIHYNVIKGLISGPPTVPDDKRSLPMMNFFARHVRKTRLHQRFVRLPVLEDIATVNDRKGVFPIFAAVRADEALTAMQHQVAGQIGNSGSIWDMLKQIYGLTYMEFTAIQNPTAVFTSLDGEILGPANIERPLLEQHPPATNAQGQVANPLATTLPSEAEFNARLRTLQENLTAAQNAHNITAAHVHRSQRGIGTAILGESNETRVLREQLDQQADRVRSVQRQISELRNAGYRHETTGAPTPATPTPPRPITVGTDPTRPIRLAQHFAKPQFFFAIPPHCNVLFPSMLDDLSYGEDYSDQPTRIYVNDSVMGRVLRSSGTNREFMLHALTVAYPEEADAVMHAHTPEGATQSNTLHETGKNLLIWPEEFYKGPVTAKMELPSWFQTMLQFLNAQKGGGGSTVTGGTPVGTPAGTINPAVLVGPNPIVSIPQRGREDSRVYLPDSWVLPPSVIAAGEAHPDIQYDNGDGSVLPGQTMRPTRVFQQLVRHIVSLFPRHLSSAPEFLRPRTRQNGSRNDLHLYGRAVDLPIRMIRGGVDHVHGDPICHWLIMNAPHFGIQFMVWATTRWKGNWNRRMGSRHGPYGNPAMNNTALHRDHIHFEVNIAGSLGQLPGYATLGIQPLPGTPPAEGGRRGANRIEHPVIAPPVSVTSAPTPRAPLTTVRRTTTGPVTPSGATAAGDTASRGAAGRVPPTTTTTTTIPEDPPEGELPANQKFAELFRLYAQYEFLRQRYMQRNGAFQLRFNPYIVPGFPCMAFDRASTSEHVVAYVYTVNHTGMGNSIATSVTATCVRTFPEFLNDVRNDCERFSERLISAPAEMIPEVRRVAQNEEQAEILYQRLFYGGQRPNGLPAAFHFDRALGYARGLEVEDISIESSTEVHVEPSHPATAPARTPEQTAALARAEAAWARAQAEDGSPVLGEGGYTKNLRLRRFEAARLEHERAVAAATPPPPPAAPAPQQMTTRTVTHNIDPNEALTPLANTIYTDAFDNYHIAMQLAARNVCTLTEFIRFWHGGRAVGDLMSAGDVEGVEEEYGYRTIVENEVNAEYTGPNGERRVLVGPTERTSASFYKRIFKMRPGPGDPPSETERGYTEGATPSSSTSGVPADYPQSRADWDSILQAYRARARNRMTPST